MPSPPSIAVSVYAEDPTEQKISKSFTLTITNQAPTVDNPMADQLITTDEQFSFQIPSNTYSDPDGHTIVYDTPVKAADDSALDSWITFNKKTATFYGYVTGAVTAFEIKITATDGYGLSVTDNFLLTVNEKPVISTTLTDKVVAPETPFNLDLLDLDDDSGTVGPVAFTDDGTITYTATLLDGTAITWLTTDPTTGLMSGTPVGADEGNYFVKVTATDEHGAEAF